MDLNELDLASRVKHYEMNHTKIALDENLPICVRIDGKTFSTYTRHLEKPFDKRLSQIMISTMNYLMEKTNAHLGYTQTDEKQEIFYAGKVQKLTSILSSIATCQI